MIHRSIALLALLGLAPAWGATNVAYLNVQEPQCANYNPATHTCGGGVEQNFNVGSDIKGWFAADSANRAAGGTSQLIVVGAATEADSTLIDLRSVGDDYWLRLSGNECNGSADLGVQIVADPDRPWHHFGAYFEIPATRWAPAYDPARDRPINAAKWGFAAGRNTVYQMDAPPELFLRYGIRLIETSPGEDDDWSQSIERQMANLYYGGGAGEFHPTYKVPWYSMISSRKDTLDANGRGTPIDTVWNHGDMYEKDGKLYYLTSDGAHPGTRHMGQPRKVVALQVQVKGVSYVDCQTGLLMDGLHFSRMGKVLNARNSKTALFVNGSLSYLHGESYYNLNFSPPQDGETRRLDGCAIVNNFIGITRAVRKHRGDAFVINGSEGCAVLDNDFFMAAAHGEGVFQRTAHTFTVGNRVYYSFGKYAYEGSSDAWVGLNEFHFNKGPYCDEENVPAEMGPLLGGNGNCQAPGVWMNGNEDEKHPALMATGSRMYVIANRAGGMSGWFTMGGVFAGRNTPYNPGDYVTDSLIWGNFHYRRQKGQRYAEDSQALTNPASAKLYPKTGGGAALVIQDEYNVNSPGRTALTQDHRFENGLCVDPVNPRPAPEPPTSGCTETRLLRENLTIAARGISFDNNTWVQTVPVGNAALLDDMARINRGAESQQVRSCAQFQAEGNVNNHGCESGDISVRNYPPISHSSIDLAITATHPGVDTGKWMTTVKSNVNGANTVTITDYRGFAVPSVVKPWLRTYLADTFDRIICGEANCADPNTPGWYPDVEYLPGGLPDGAFFVQIGNVKTAYVALTKTTGYEAQLTLVENVTVSAGDGVASVPVCGSAPDRGAEFCGAATVPDSLQANTDRFLLAPDQTHTGLEVITNDRGFGNCADSFQLKPDSLSTTDPLILGMQTVGNTVSLTVGTGESPSSLVFYEIEGTGACTETATGVIELEIRNRPGAGGPSETVITWLETPIDIEPTTTGSWQLRDLVALGSLPADTAGVYAFSRQNFDPGNAVVGVRPSGNTDDLFISSRRAGQQFMVEPTGPNATIEAYRDMDLPQMEVRAYFSPSTAITWNDPHFNVGLVCDGTWRAMAYPAGALVIFRAPNPGLIQFRYGEGLAATLADASVRYYPMLTANANGDIEYNCPNGSAMTSLEEVAIFDPSVVTVAPGGWEIFDPLSGDTEIAPTVACPGDEGCAAYVVAALAQNNRRFDVKDVQAKLDNKEGNTVQGFLIMRPNANGKLWVRSNSDSTQYAIVAGFNSGAVAETPDPLVWRLDTCPGTDSLDNRAPDLSLHGGVIRSTAACDGTGNVALNAGQYLAAPLGVANGTLELSTRASGRFQLEFNHDGNQHTRTPGQPGQASTKLVLDFINNTARLATNTPGQADCGAVHDLSGRFGANEQVFIKVVAQGETGSRSLQAWIENRAVLDTDQPRVSCTYSGAIPANGMVLQLRQQEANSGLLLPLTWRGTQQVDTSPPVIPSLSCDTLGLVVSCQWGLPADVGPNSSRRVQWVRLEVDDAAVLDLLPGDTQSAQWTAPLAGPYTMKVVFSDPAANESEATEAVTVSAGNNPPVLGTPGTAVVPVGMNRPSESTSLDMVELCGATDPEGDPIYVAAFGTVPEEADVVSLRPNSGVIDYRHDQAQLGASPIQVILADNQGGQTGICTVPVTVSAPPYFQEPMVYRTMDSPGTTVNWTATIWPYGTAWPPSTEPPISNLVGSSEVVAAPCPSWASNHPFACGEITGWIEPYEEGVEFNHMPPVEIGVPVPVSGSSIEVGPDGDHFSFHFRGYLKEYQP